MMFKKFHTAYPDGLYRRVIKNNYILFHPYVHFSSLKLMNASREKFKSEPGIEPCISSHLD